MKRTIAILLAVVTAMALLAGCSGRDNNNVSTTPNGTVNGSNNEAVAPNNQRPGTPDQNNDFEGAVVDPVDPPMNNDTTTEENRPENNTTEESPMEEFGNDMKDAAQDAMDDAENAVEDITGNGARARRSGTGMAGGR